MTFAELCCKTGPPSTKWPAASDCRLIASGVISFSVGIFTIPFIDQWQDMESLTTGIMKAKIAGRVVFREALWIWKSSRVKFCRQHSRSGCSWAESRFFVARNADPRGLAPARCVSARSVFADCLSDAALSMTSSLLGKWYLWPSLSSPSSEESRAMRHDRYLHNCESTQYSFSLPLSPCDR